MNRQDWIDRRFPFTGFGDDPDLSVKFITITGWNDPIPDWSGGDAKLSEHDIHNSDDQVTQYHGRKPWILTARLWFGDPDDMEIMDALQGQPHTLRLRWGLTKRAGGYQETRNHRQYLVLPDTLLVSLKDQETRVDGTPQAVATFRRTATAAHYLGFTELQGGDE